MYTKSLSNHIPKLHATSSKIVTDKNHKFYAHDNKCKSRFSIASAYQRSNCLRCVQNVYVFFERFDERFSPNPKGFSKTRKCDIAYTSTFYLDLKCRQMSC